MINQLRLYEIFDGTRQEFLDRFRDHAARIMKQHDFRILAMWQTTHNDRPAFAYLLSWDSEEHMRTAWARFMADEEWKAIKAARAPEAGPIVGGITDLTLAPVEFSAALGANDE